MNGVYLQLHAYMLRGRHSLRHAVVGAAAHARRTSRGVTTAATATSPRGRTSQFNWIKLRRPAGRDGRSRRDRACTACRPAATACATSPPTSGPRCAPDEIEDPRIYAEILRQHCTMHPEFTFLPRKFKIARDGGRARPRRDPRPRHRPAHASRTARARWASRWWSAAGSAARPFVGKTMKPFLHKRDLLSYIEAILRVLQPVRPPRQHLQGAHQDPGARARRREVRPRGRGRVAVDQGRRAGDRPGADRATSPRISAIRTTSGSPTSRSSCERARSIKPHSGRWFRNSVSPRTRSAGYAIVTLSLKPEGAPPGDATAEQMDTIADLADRYSFGEIRVGHEQNLVLPHVAQRDLPALWRRSMRSAWRRRTSGSSPTSSPARGSTIAALANTRSIPVAQELTRRFAEPRRAAQHRPAAHQHLGLHQRLRPSPRRPHRHPRRREERRGVLPDHARRPRRRAG